MIVIILKLASILFNISICRIKFSAAFTKDSWRVRIQDFIPTLNTAGRLRLLQQVHPSSAWLLNLEISTLIPSLLSMALEPGNLHLDSFPPQHGS